MYLCKFFNFIKIKIKTTNTYINVINAKTKTIKRELL